MYNILDFIDSPDIREYNKDTKFTPGEQMCLIILSNSAPIGLKRDALTELLNRYTDEDLCDGHWFIEGLSGCTRHEQAEYLKSLALHEITLWDIAEELLMDDNSDIIFAGFAYELGEGCSNPNLYYYYHGSTFDMLKHMLIASNDNSNDNNNSVRRYDIYRIKLNDMSDINQIRYTFNEKFELLMIDIPESYHPDYNEDAEILWLYDLNVLIQLPFKQGDILKYIDGHNRKCCGLLQSDPYVSEEKFNWHVNNNHVSMMSVNLEGICDIDKYTKQYRMWYDHVSRLDLVKCEDQELKSLEEKCLKVLQNIKYGNDWEGFIDLVNHTGFLFDQINHI